MPPPKPKKIKIDGGRLTAVHADRRLRLRILRHVGDNRIKHAFVLRNTARPIDQVAGIPVDRHETMADGRMGDVAIPIIDECLDALAWANMRILCSRFEGLLSRARGQHRRGLCAAVIPSPPTAVAPKTRCDGDPAIVPPRVYRDWREFL